MYVWHWTIKIHNFFANYWRPYRQYSGFILQYCF